MKDLGSLHHFLGITVERRPDKLFLHQRTYTLDILKRAIMTDCKPCSTPVDLKGSWLLTPDLQFGIPPSSEASPGRCST
jgi:hypothetical protein